MYCIIFEQLILYNVAFYHTFNKIRINANQYDE